MESNVERMVEEQPSVQIYSFKCPFLTCGCLSGYANVDYGTFGYFISVIRNFFKLDQIHE